MFKECLRSNVTPFILTDDLRPFYIRGPREFDRMPGYLLDTCGAVQDRFEALYLPMAEEFWSLMQEGSSTAATDGHEPKSRAAGHMNPTN